MKYFLFLIFSGTLLLLPFSSAEAQRSDQNIPIDKILILIENYEGGVKVPVTEQIDFSAYPTTLGECKNIAREYKDLSGRDGFVFCYSKGQRAQKYKF